MSSIRISNWLRLALMSLILGLLGASLSACNASRGFGEDVESVGKDIQGEAEDAK